MKETNNTSSGGIWLCGLLADVFIVLKLCNVITWPWLWVLAPVWIPLALYAALLIIFGIAAIIAAVNKK